MDIIRVLRVVEYVGPRDQVEEQVANSIHGQRKVRDMTIRAVTLGEWPEMLYREVQLNQSNDGLAPWEAPTVKGG